MRIIFRVLALLAPLRAAAQEKPLKILAIGNSFSRSMMRSFPELAGANGKRLLVCNAFIGGCVLSQHWANVERSERDPAFKPYEMTMRDESGRTLFAGAGSVNEFLTREAWDVVGNFYWEKTAEGRKLAADPCHLNERGEMLQALVWYTFFLGSPERLVCPAKVVGEEAVLFRALAAEAVRLSK